MIGYMDPFSSIANPPQDNYVIIDNVRVYTVMNPPMITVQPTNATINAGANAAFTVDCGGTAPFAYQWRFANTNLPGATSSNLFLTNVASNQAGTYSVVVTNAAGSATSSNSLLSVVGMSVTDAQFTNGTFQLTATGAPAVYTLLASSNLVDWVALTTLTNVSGPFQFTDALAGALPQRFYRIAAPK
jgi:hypothetical protein